MINKRIALLSLSLFAPLLFGFLLFASFSASHTALAAPAAGQVVNTLVDENNGGCTVGACSLREAITDTTPGATITFIVSGTIPLSESLGDLDIAKNLTIDGGGLITVSGESKIRVFNVTSGNVTFDDLTIEKGKFTGAILNCGIASDKGGGGILNDGASVTVKNSTLSNNTADCGGAILNDGILTVENSTFSGNSADVGSGGAIDNRSGKTATIEDSTFSNNTAVQNGGAVTNFGTVNLTRSTLNGNEAASLGGGAYNQWVVNVINSTFSDNLASEGGGLHNLCSGDSAVDNSTFSKNRAKITDGGGGIVSGGDGCTANKTTVSNTIVSGNVKDGTSTADDLALSGGTNSSFVSGGYNLIGTMGSGITFAGPGDQINENDPKLDSLADNGGATWTHAFKTGSLAIDAGNCSGGPATDQRGLARPQDNTCDIGAYEQYLTVIVTSSQSSGPGSLRDAIAKVAPTGLITFAKNLDKSTIDVSPDGELEIKRPMTINACNIEINISGNNSTRSFNVLAKQTTLECINIQDGRANDCPEDFNFFVLAETCGGSILVQAGAELTATGGTISGSSADFGGAIASNGLVKFFGTTFMSNTATVDGGAVYQYDSLKEFDRYAAISLGNCPYYIDSGPCSFPPPSYPVTIAPNFVNNSAGRNGGAIAIKTIPGGTADSNSALSGRMANYLGAGPSDLHVVLQVNQTFSGNSAQFGGAIHNDGAIVSIINSTFSGNTASESGGAIHNQSETVNVSSSTLYDNRAGTSGGAISSQGNTSTTTTITNTIVSGNLITPSNAANDIALYAGIVNSISSGGYNLVGTMGPHITLNSPGDQIGENDPKLGPLADNGGSVLTHALLPGSPAIDAGGNCAVAIDQRNVERPQGPACDTGAYELIPGYEISLPVIIGHPGQ